MTESTDVESQQNQRIVDAEMDLITEKERQIALLREEIKASKKRNTRLREIVDGLRENIDGYDKGNLNDCKSDRSNEIEVETLQTKIELKAKDIVEIKEHQKSNFVPIAMYQRLEDCIKESEVDSQKLWKQNEFLEKNVEELEDELDDVLIKTGIKVKDGTMLWRRVDTTKIIDNE